MLKVLPHNLDIIHEEKRLSIGWYTYIHKKLLCSFKFCINCHFIQNNLYHRVESYSVEFNLCFLYSWKTENVKTVRSFLYLFQPSVMKICWWAKPTKHMVLIMHKRYGAGIIKIMGVLFHHIAYKRFRYTQCICTDIEFKIVVYVYCHIIVPYLLGIRDFWGTFYVEIMQKVY